MEAKRTGAGSMGFGGKEWSIDEKPFKIDHNFTELPVSGSDK